MILNNWRKIYLPKFETLKSPKKQRQTSCSSNSKAKKPLRKTYSKLISYTQNSYLILDFSSSIIGMSFTSNLSEASAHLSPKHSLARIFQACLGSRSEFSPFLGRQRRSPCNSRHRRAHLNQSGRSVYLLKLIAALKSRSLISAPQCGHFQRLSESFSSSFFSPQ